MASEIRWTVTYPDTDNDNQLMELDAQHLEHAQLLASRISQLHGSATIANDDNPPFHQAWVNGSIWVGTPNLPALLAAFGRTLTEEERAAFIAEAES